MATLLAVIPYAILRGPVKPHCKMDRWTGFCFTSSGIETLGDGGRRLKPNGRPKGATASAAVAPDWGTVGVRK